MRNIVVQWLLVSLLSWAAKADCSSDLLIDDFSDWSTYTNSLGAYTSDDRTMISISSGENTLSFKPGAGSYFYENIPCGDATSDDYTSLSFDLQAPSGGAVLLEVQSKHSCSDDSFERGYYMINDLTGATQDFTIPLASFSPAPLDVLTAVTWSTFTDNSIFWLLRNVQLACRTGENTDPRDTQCADLLIDDWESQSRLTFLYYNAMIQPSSDDGTMQSIVVNNDNTVTLKPESQDSSYFYSKTNCTNAEDKYGGISLPIKAPKDTSFGVQLGSPTSCGDEQDSVSIYRTTAQLEWTFDGTEQLYSIPFSKFKGLELTMVNTVLFDSFSNAVTFGPMAFYCGTTPTEYQIPATTTPPEPTATVAAPTGTASALVVDKFGNQNGNTLGFWHGADDGMTLTWDQQKLTIQSTDSDYSFYTQLSDGCRDMTSFKGSYLHIAYSGSNKFTVALQQNNAQCDPNVAPYPETWDSLEAARYASDSDIYIPMDHFNINHTRVLGVALKGFYTTDTTTLTKIEIVPSIPSSITIPRKLASGNLVFACKRPNSFAFAIDDGSPELAQRVMAAVKEAGIKVTFFTVGAPLEDATTNLTSVYREMMDEGHQIALHSFTHPKMEGLPDDAAIDWEYANDLTAAAQAFGTGFHTPYFRPPFGNEGARMRQRLAMALDTDEPYVVMWSVDVEDWKWAETDTPEKQLDAFRDGLDAGGNLVVMHYLYESTVDYLPQFIQMAKDTGKQLMRVDQCMEDPNAPAL